MFYFVRSCMNMFIICFQNYLCGFQPFCEINSSERALNLARSNVENFFTVVGVLEMMAETREVMDCLLGDFLGGIKGIRGEIEMLEEES